MRAKKFENVNSSPSLQDLKPEDKRGPSREAAHCLFSQPPVPYSCLGLRDTEWTQLLLGPALSRHR